MVAIQTASADSTSIKAILVKVDVSGCVVPVTHNQKLYQRLGDRNYWKSTFPIALAYAMTIHASQGATISGKCIIHITSSFTVGLGYVVVSRVTDRRNLFVVGGLQPDMFRPIPPLRTPQGHLANGQPGAVGRN